MLWCGYVVPFGSGRQSARARSQASCVPTVSTHQPPNRNKSYRTESQCRVSILLLIHDDCRSNLVGLCTHIVHYTLVQYMNRHSIRTVEFIQLTGKPRTICDYTRMCHCRPSAIRRRKSFTELITVYSPKSIFVVRFRARELCHHCRLRVGCTHILHASPAQ